MTRRPAWILFALTTVILLGAPLAAVQAQGGGNVTCGVEVTGTINNAYPDHSWTLMLKTDETVTITMLQASGDLDPYLKLLSFDGTLLAENDDAPNLNYNAQLIQTLSGGRYTIHATRFAEAAGATSGDYTLSVVCGAVIPPTPVTTTTMTGNVLFADDFSRDTGTWGLGQDENGTVTITGGELRVLNYTTAEGATYTTAGQNLGDFIWTVDSRLVGGALDNWHTFAFRALDFNNYYAVSYSADGWYTGVVMRNGQRVEEMAAPAQSSAIRQGIGATNTVRIEAIGNQVHFYVNDVQLIDYVVSPANAISSGDIGLTVASLSGADYSEVAFDNVLVVAPGGVVAPSTPVTTAGVLFADDFSRDTGTWWVGQDENGTVTITGGELRIRNYTSAQYTAHTEAGQNLGDFIWTVDSRLVDGALDNWHYFSFRYVDASNRYRVGYSADGWYMGEVVRNGEQVEEWVTPTQSPVIRQGVGATNTVRIEAIGNQVRFFINDTLMIDRVVSPANAIPSGDIGLAVASMSGADYSEVAFDNVLVVAPGGAVAPPTPVTTAGVLFADDFSVDTGEWWLNSDAYGDVYLRNGELVIRDVYDDSALYSGPTPILDDFVLEVDSRLVSGTLNNWHFFLLRLNENGDCYRVGYSADGYYVGTEFYGNSTQNWVQPTFSQVINQGVGATNHVRIEVQGTSVRFYVNGTLLLDAVATNRLPAGYIALSADALEAPETVVAYDNLVITAL
ncbi:MAG: hypothetical protein HPY64_05800 [Anaerolineae bacterium]|nr:hypothetical protein [Anaerolineae bacterium]